MNIHQAIMKAADHIESRPDLFNFFQTVIPNYCGTPGCALGWIGHFYGVNRFDFKGASFHGDVLCVGDQLLGTPQRNLHTNHPFYNRLDALNKGWRWRASECAIALRLYAGKYHPAGVESSNGAFERFLATAMRAPEVTAAEKSG